MNLKPCPFCGGKAEAKVRHYDPDCSDYAYPFVVECGRCGARTEATKGIEQANECWNSRPAEAELLEACGKAFDYFVNVTLNSHSWSLVKLLSDVIQKYQKR